jgi:hypothetical protein
MKSLESDHRGTLSSAFHTLEHDVAPSVSGRGTTYREDFAPVVASRDGRIAAVKTEYEWRLS